jgi:hypothetical protein
MDHYREVARSVWNMGFWAVEELRDWGSRDRFEQVKKLLFYAAVAARIDQPGECCKDLTTINLSLRVVPRSSERIPIMIERPREGDANRYWDDPVGEVSASEAEFEFADYFDCNEMACADFQYYRVRVLAFASQPHLVGRQALIEHRHAGVFVGPRLQEPLGRPPSG